MEPVEQREQQEMKSALPELKSTRFNFRFILIGIVLVIVCLLIVAYLLSNAKKYNGNSSALTQSANNSYQKGDLNFTKKALEDALNNFPSDPKLQSALITTIANKGNLNGSEGNAFAEGKPFAEKAIRDNSHNADVLIAVGYLYEVGGRYSEALNYYEKALQIEPNNANGLFHKGHVLEFLNRTQESNDAYLKAYSIDKTNPSILMALGKMELSQGKTDDAVAYYKAAAAAPGTPPYLKAEALTNASIIKRNQILYMEEAIQLSKEAVSVDPKFSPALATHGFNLGINGRMDEGLDYMKKAIAANPRISQNYWYLGMLLRSIKNYSEALKYQQEGYARVDTDNTLIGITLRSKVKGAMAYDLAKTTYLSGTTKGVVELLTIALTLDPALKKQLQSDIRQYNQFKSLASNPLMQQLIK